MAENIKQNPDEQRCATSSQCFEQVRQGSTVYIYVSLSYRNLNQGKGIYTVLYFRVKTLFEMQSVKIGKRPESAILLSQKTDFYWLSARGSVFIKTVRTQNYSVASK